MSSAFSGVVLLLLVDDLSSICSGHASESNRESQILLRFDISISMTLDAALEVGGDAALEVVDDAAIEVLGAGSAGPDEVVMEVAAFSAGMETVSLGAFLRIASFIKSDETNNGSDGIRARRRRFRT